MAPCFSSHEWSLFAQSYQFKRVTSHPHYPQSNGKVEKGEHIVNQLIYKAVDSASDIHLVLLAVPNTTPPTFFIGTGCFRECFHRELLSDAIPLPLRWIRLLRSDSNSFRQSHQYFQFPKFRFLSETDYSSTDSDSGSFRILEMELDYHPELRDLTIRRPQLKLLEDVPSPDWVVDNWETVKNFQAKPDDLLIATYPKSGERRTGLTAAISVTSSKHWLRLFLSAA
ncbi:uncharacterized protein LOC119954796 [Scyliorhinus canicula]|uniref:uncharacterized protein LOC119954796 n=1 Tax=Scyliorhinus canicula TaxID=7830 RepID=UPI0018F52B61|nr:uncharacterized protein LOC119954796 [Scyliorhinus canicula]